MHKFDFYGSQSTLDFINKSIPWNPSDHFSSVKCIGSENELYHSYHYAEELTSEIEQFITFLTLIDDSLLYFIRDTENRLVSQSNYCADSRREVPPVDLYKYRRGMMPNNAATLFTRLFNVRRRVMGMHGYYAALEAINDVLDQLHGEGFELVHWLKSGIAYAVEVNQDFTHRTYYGNMPYFEEKYDKAMKLFVYKTALEALGQTY